VFKGDLKSKFIALCYHQLLFLPLPKKRDYVFVSVCVCVCVSVCVYVRKISNKNYERIFVYFFTGEGHDQL